MRARLRISAALVLAALTAAAPRQADAACNLIPSASKSFRGTLGDLNRPFAGPNDFVEVGASSARCAGASPGFSSEVDDQIVSVVFKPPGGAPRVAFITSGNCFEADAQQKLAACEATVGGGNVSCVQAGPLASAVNLAVVERNGERKVSFRFPDTDALLAPDFDDRTLSGPATIAVSRSADPLPCGLAATSCANQPGLLACVDELYALDGSCDPTPNTIFPGFTALPEPNDFQAGCFRDDPPCTALASETRFAVDGGGNLLLPVHWSGVLIRQDDLPVPRLIRATIKSPLPFPVPDAAFLASYTPEGAKLPPIFEPQSDPSVTDPDVITLFGSADASYTILRFGRRAGVCEGGTLDGNACSTDLDCRGGTCPTTCVGGPNADQVCTTDDDCAGSRCGALFTDFRPIASWGGPLPLRRQAVGSCLAPPHQSCALPEDCPGDGNTCVGAGICQLAPHATCADDGDCPAEGDACVSYAFEATTAIPLESLSSGSTDVFSFTVNESTRLRDENGDGDTVDSVVTLRDRVTGDIEPMGASASCPLLAGTASGRAVVRIYDPPFRYPAAETDGDLVAFLESEAAAGACDQNVDTDVADPILRVFALGGGERTSTLVPPHVADTALAVNYKALAVSNGLVFYRRPERGAAPGTVRRASVATGGGEAASGISLDFDGPYFRATPDGRFVLFPSDSNDLVPDDTNFSGDVFVHDNLTGTTERANLGTGGSQTFGSGSGFAMSADARFVAFGTFQSLVPEDQNFNADVYVHDRLLDTTERVSDIPGGGDGSGGPPGILSTDPQDISADGRFVLFYSYYENLVPNDTNGDYDLFVRDRLLGTTERVSVRDDGSQSSPGTFLGSISADGRFVVFPSPDGQIVAGDFNNTGDVFVRDRLLQRTEIVSVTTGGGQLGIYSGLTGSFDISDDGRFVLFGTDAPLAPSDTNGVRDLYVRDRQLGITELVSVATGGVPLPTGPSSGANGGVSGSLSGDGRYVGFTAPDEADAVAGDSNGFLDAFVYDRQTGITQRVSVDENGGQLNGDSRRPIVSDDGGVVAFRSAASNLVAADTNGAIDAFVRAPDSTNGALDLFPDGTLDDSVLAVFDASSQTANLLCPAGDVAVADGRAAFLRPESPTGTALCPSGSLNPGADSDTDDQVVQLWDATGGVQNLGLAASAVVLSPTHVAALADEEAQGATDVNGDGDATDDVVHVRALAGGGWTDVGEAADTIEACGTLFPFVTPESAQGADRNGDGDQNDRVLQVWDATAASLRNVALAADEFVCGGALVAFRSPENASGPHRNGDADATDHVLTVYDASTGQVRESAQAITPCRIAECDPRQPFLVIGRTVKFLTLESEQGNTDLNGDGDAVDLVIQIFDLDSGRTRTVGTVRDGSDPLGRGDTLDTDTATVYTSSGLCLESENTFCLDETWCAGTSICRDSVCQRETGVCASQLDCAPGSSCVAAGIVPASPDSDVDGVPDHIDSCPYTGPADQTDTDGDGVGDACDVSTCGNDVREGSEICDGLDSASCPASCSAQCTCCTPVTDPKAAVTMRTKKEAGVLNVRMAIPLGAYAGEPVTVRLADSDSDPIVLTNVGALPPKGKQGKMWTFTSKTDGVKRVALVDDTKKHPGMFKLQIATKKWFTAAQANRPAAETAVTVTIGSQCFSHVVEKKTD